MKKILFIDRDGTLILEPDDEQIDSLEKLVFYPKVFQYLSRIASELEYELVMVSNQDGLGTKSFPTNTFELPHNKLIEAFKNEGIVFSEILIDSSFAEENSPNRKPKTGLLKHYMMGNYDLEHSFVIGDRISDVELAKNLGCKAIYISERTNKDVELATTEWSEIYAFLKQEPRKASILRKTSETNCDIELNIDGSGKSDIATGIGFFNHMLEQIARHGGIDLKIQVAGDLHIDEHHTIEDVGIALGEAFLRALGKKKGIARYGFLLPMDDCLAQVAIDFGGRPWIVWNVNFSREKIGEMPTEMFFHFFKSFSDNAKCNLNIQAEGENEHHKIEAVFKSFGKALKMAVKRGENIGIPSTKGII